MAAPVDPELLDTAVTLARQAGELTLQYFRRDDLAGPRARPLPCQVAQAIGIARLGSEHRGGECERRGQRQAEAATAATLSA